MNKSILNKVFEACGKKDQFFMLFTENKKVGLVGNFTPEMLYGSLRSIFSQGQYDDGLPRMITQVISEVVHDYEEDEDIFDELQDKFEEKYRHFVNGDTNGLTNEDIDECIEFHNKIKDRKEFKSAMKIKDILNPLVEQFIKNGSFKNCDSLIHRENGYTMVIEIQYPFATLKVIDMNNRYRYIETLDCINCLSQAFAKNYHRYIEGGFDEEVKERLEYDKNCNKE